MEARSVAAGRTDAVVLDIAFDGATLDVVRVGDASDDSISALAITGTTRLAGGYTGEPTRDPRCGISPTAGGDLAGGTGFLRPM